MAPPVLTLTRQTISTVGAQPLPIPAHDSDTLTRERRTLGYGFVGSPSGWGGTPLLQLLRPRFSDGRRNEADTGALWSFNRIMVTNENPPPLRVYLYRRLRVSPPGCYHPCRYAAQPERTHLRKRAGDERVRDDRGRHRPRYAHPSAGYGQLAGGNQSRLVSSAGHSGRGAGRRPVCLHF